MAIQFVDPAYLLLLFLLPWFWRRAGRLRDLGRARWWMILLLRTLVFALVVLAVAQTQVARRTQLLSVLFALDLSESIPFDQRMAAFERVRAAAAGMGRNDLAGVVVFGRDASLDTPAQPFLGWERPSSLLDDDGTDIAAGLRLALASLPAETQKRIVLFSDGNDTRGTALTEADRLAGLGVPVDVYPLEYRHEAEVFVEKIVHKNRINEDEPVSIDVFVESTQAGPAQLRLLLENELLIDQPVTLQPGKNKFTVPSIKLPKRSFYRLEARVESPSDTSLENNRAGGFVTVQGRPQMLLVEGDAASGSVPEAFIAQAQAEGIAVSVVAPADLTADPAQLLAYDTIVLSNVAASDLSPKQMDRIEKAVKDLGIGLMMVGGEQSFGAGGYRGTPIEEVLPVSMDIKDRKIIPSGALAIVLHTCEIPDGNNWMRQVAIESIRVLDENDEVGMLDYQGNVRWIFPMARKGDGRRQVALIKAASPGDMPDFESAMKLGYNGLVTCTSVLKHLIVISDGDPSPPSAGLLKQFAQTGITISTVLIGGHGMDFRGVMGNIARTTGGRFYEVTDPRNLPRIFSREAARVKRNLLQEEPFIPNQVAETELTESFSPEDYPTLLGYVITTPKSGADLPLVTHQEDPLLAHWRYGLGRAVAFTSDFKPKWAPQWIEWEGFGKFWVQAIRWVSKRKMEGDYRVSVTNRDGKGVVVVESFDDQGNPVNYLDFNGKVISPENETLDVRLVQTDLGRYEGEFDADQSGTYLVSLAQPADSSGDSPTLLSGLSVPYSPEFSYSETNSRLLKEIASRTRGRFEPPTESLFDHSLAAFSKPLPLWPWLLGIAVCLFWFDVFVRRVLIDWADVSRGTAAAWRRLTMPRQVEASGTMERLKQAKEGVSGHDLPPVPLAPEQRFDFNALEKKSVEDIDLSKPEGRKAPPTKRGVDSGPRVDAPQSGRTTERLLELKRKKEPPKD